MNDNGVEQSLVFQGLLKNNKKMLKIMWNLTHDIFTAISRPVGYGVYRLASNMLKSLKSCKPLKAKFLSLLLSNQKEIIKRDMIWTEQKPKGTTFKVQSLGLANPLCIDLIHHCMTHDTWHDMWHLTHATEHIVFGRWTLSQIFRSLASFWIPNSWRRWHLFNLRNLVV